MRAPLVLLFALSACTTGDVDTDVVDTDTDVTPTCEYEVPERPTPGVLKAGVARRRVPAPLGIGTAGFGPFGAPSSPTPFSDIYPGTQRIHGHPEVKVVVISRGPGAEAIFVRLDAVGVFAQLRREIVLAASAKVGHDLDHAILLGATHTHSGPSRVLNTGGTGTSPYDFIADTFFPEFYKNFVEDISDAIADAYADLKDARLGTTVALCDEGHNDRRCVDGEIYQNPKLPMLVVEREGQVDAVVMAYAVHGTIFGIDDLFLSQDVSGAIEEAVEDRFDHPVEVVMFNAWGADMSPGSAPSAPVQTSGITDGGFKRQRQVGYVVADAVDEGLENLTWTTEPPIQLETHRVAIDREKLGYDVETFPYDYGAVYCTGGSESCDPGKVRDDELDQKCLIRFPEDYPAPNQTDVTVGRIANFALTTFPGECGTRLAEKLMDDLLATMPDADDVLFLGYTQDYLGYSILEEDWWYGEYEASGSLWGPRQGEHLWHEIAADFNSFVANECPADEPAALVPFPYTVDTPYISETALDFGTIVTQPDDVGQEGVISFTVNGADPWERAPLAWLETEEGVPVTRPNGVRSDSDDHNWEVQLAPSPAYTELVRGDRAFAWTFKIGVRQPVEGGMDLEPGTYVMKVSLPHQDGPTTVTSRVFTVFGEMQ